MRVMVDADILLERLLTRPRLPVECADELWELIRLGQLRGYIAEVGLSKIYSTFSCKSELEELISEIRAVVEVCLVDLKILNKARSLAIPDFESALEWTIASAMELDAIVTLNPESFPLSDDIPVYSIEKLLATILERTISLDVKHDCLLSQWFDNNIEVNIEASGWLLAEEVFGSKQLDYALRYLPDRDTRIVRRVKVINLTNDSETHQIALCIDLSEDTEGQTIWILPQIYALNSGGRNAWLPEGLQLIVLDESGQIFDGIEAQSDINVIQLNDWFGDFPGTKFSIQVVLGQDSFTDNFVI